MPAFKPAVHIAVLACFLVPAGKAEAGGPGAETGGNSHFHYVVDTTARADTASRPPPAPPPTKQQLQAQRTATGLGEIILGTLISFIGMVTKEVQSWPKCEPPEVGASGFEYGNGPCTDGGPSQTGQAVGLGIAVTGGVMIADGIRRVVVPLR